MKKILLSLFTLFVVAANILSASRADAQDLPIDKKATKETINLYRNLKKLSEKGFMFGHQDALAYGVGWQYEKERSDIKDVTGDHPAVYGWELGNLELDHLVNLDSVPFVRMKQMIREGYSQGGVITISWHLNNPLTGKTAWHPAEGTMKAILPGGEKHELYKEWLNKVASFLNDLKGNKGEFIPVIFRPFHELNGSWFWWGGKNSTAEELKNLWQFTVSYLRDEKKLHHLLYAYNTDRFSSREEYLDKYPGDEWVDLIGFDIYQRNSSNDQFIADIDKMLSLLAGMAKEKNKISALTEFGGNLKDNDWWTDTFLKGIGKHHIAYVLGWRNAGAKPGGMFEAYVPYKGHSGNDNFINFYKTERTFFQKDVSAMNLYGK